MDLIAAICATRPDAESLAEVVLAHKLKLPKPVPLLLPERFGPAFRTIGGRSRVRPGEPVYAKADRHDRAVCPRRNNERQRLPGYVEQVLLSTLQPGDIVVMDNSPAHKTARVGDTIKCMGPKLMFLPPDSPDFNPIENAFSKLEAMLRARAERKVRPTITPHRAPRPSFMPHPS